MIKAISTAAILLCLLSTVAASAQSPVISSITPQEGPTEGGTRVRIDGQNLTPPCRPGSGSWPARVTARSQYLIPSTVRDFQRCR